MLCLRPSFLIHETGMILNFQGSDRLLSTSNSSDYHNWVLFPAQALSQVLFCGAAWNDICKRSKETDLGNGIIQFVLFFIRLLSFRTIF